MKPQHVLFALLALLLAAPAPEAYAGWAVLNHNGDSLLTGTARCIVAPTTTTNRLRVHRIRITRSGTSNVSYRFTAAVTEDTAGDSESVTSCSLPGCQHLFTAEGLVEGRIFDLTGLDLLLPPGGRLYVSEDSHYSEYATIEVFYSES